MTRAKIVEEETQEVLKATQCEIGILYKIVKTDLGSYNGNTIIFIARAADRYFFYNFTKGTLLVYAYPDFNVKLFNGKITIQNQEE